METQIASVVFQALGSSVEHLSPAGGGCINSSAHCLLKDGTECFVKWNYSSPENFFSAEVEGLRRLRVATSLVVPDVLSYSDSSQPRYLILRFLNSGSRDYESLARGLAELHSCRAESFGFENANFIGLTPQENDWKESWADFFIQNRLEPQIELGMHRGWIERSVLRRFSQVLERIHNELSSKQTVPSLLHGDLWSGNILFSSEGPALIDPACYFGDREADLAMTELFGGFPNQFYDVYRAVNPLEPGYERRKELLNLYHIMNHANLFGGGYRSQVFRLVSSLSL